MDTEDFIDVEGSDLEPDESCQAGRKRNYHNVLERKRRNHIKDGYTKLRDTIPDLSGKKVSRIQTLKRAVEHISFLKGEIKQREMHMRDVELHLKALEDVADVLKTS